jgi:hypothetical protein
LDPELHERMVPASQWSATRCLCVSGSFQGKTIGVLISANLRVVCTVTVEP